MPSVNVVDEQVLVDFFAEWCGPCQTLAPILDGLARKHSSTVFAKVDVDRAKDCAKEHRVTAMPTIVFFKNKAEVGRVVGADVNAIHVLIKKHESPDVFTGVGQTLGGGSNTSSTSSHVGAVSASSCPIKTVDGPGGSCQIQVRLLDGSAIRGDFEPSHSLQQVHDFVKANLEAKGVPSISFSLMANFPKV